MGASVFIQKATLTAMGLTVILNYEVDGVALMPPQPSKAASPGNCLIRVPIRCVPVLMITLPQVVSDNIEVAVA